MTHDEYVLAILQNADENGHIKCRERNDLEYKETFNANSFAKYAKTMASFANNQGGYIIFGVKDRPRAIKGVNDPFFDFSQEKFTDCLNSLFSPEMIWITGVVEINSVKIGYIYTDVCYEKPVIALKHDSGEKITAGDIFYRYRAQSSRIKYPEMRRIIEDTKRREQERILKLIESLKDGDGANIGIVNYVNGRLSTPYGVDIEIDKKLVAQMLRKAKFIKAGQFSEVEGEPVIKVTGNIDLSEEIPVPDIDPNQMYPYFEKDLIEQTQLSQTEVRALVAEYKIKGQKKYHNAIPITKHGQVANKYSIHAIGFLREEVAKHKEDVLWLQEIVAKYNKANRDRRKKKK